MPPLLAEWLAKAEADWTSALREYQARRQPNYDAACFHAQQCAEKYLKGLLQVAGTPFPKTHDLDLLVQLLGLTEPEWLALDRALRELSAMAVAFRYPGRCASKEMAREALATARGVRVLARRRLGLAE